MIFRNCYTQFHVPLGEWNLRQFWNITSGIYAKYHVQIILLFVYTTTRKRFVIFTCRNFKWSWNTTVLSQSNCSNFLCSSINWSWNFTLNHSQISKRIMSVFAIKNISHSFYFTRARCNWPLLLRCPCWLSSLV